MNRLQNKVAIVTGANSGIGLRTAQLFAEEGAILVLCARRKEKLDEVAEALRAQGSQVLSIAADVSREEDCVRVVEEAVKAFGRVDVLVNNAGMADKHRPITRCDGDWWHTVIDVNQNSVYYMMKAALKYMELAGYGSIVNRLHRRYPLQLRRSLYRIQNGCDRHEQKCGHSVCGQGHPGQRGVPWTHSHRPQHPGAVSHF